MNNGIRALFGTRSVKDIFRIFSCLALALPLLIGSVSAQAQAERFPSPADLPSNPLMPNPFVKLDGTGPTSPDEWPAHRAYLKELMQHYLYGHIPPRPSWDELSFRQTFDEPYSPPDSSIEGRRQGYEITVTRNGLSHSFNFSLYRGGEVKPYPTLINNRVDDTFGPEEGVRRGYLFVEFNRDEVAPDQAGNADRSEGIFRLYPEPEYDWHTIAAWAWAYQLVIDVVDRLGLADTDKIIVTGHSRGGQTAMAAAIFDERIDVVAPSTGGPFSLGSHRQRDPEGFRGTWDYPARFKAQQPHWYHPRYAEFSGELQNSMPWDVSTLVALLAPRAICHVNSVDDKINNRLAHEAGVRVGQDIYSWWDKQDLVRVHWRGVSNDHGQTGHDQGREEYEAIYDCGDEYFYNKPGSTSWNVSPGKNTWEYDPEEYPLLIDWTIPEAVLSPGERLAGMRSGVDAWLDPDRSAPAGTIYQTFRSEVIDGQASYLVYLPPGYSREQDKRYPVVYWLHGARSSQRTGFYFVERLNEAIRTGTAPEMIAILVNGRPGSWYFDHPDGSLPAESILIKDLVPHVDRTYRTVQDRRGRAIEGWSMGGFGALRLSFKYPEIFSATTTVAGGVWIMEGKGKMGRPLWNPKWISRILGTDTELYRQVSAWGLLETQADEIRGKLAIRMITGQDNGLKRRVRMHGKLGDLNIAHEYIKVPGAGHSYIEQYEGLSDEQLFGFYRKAFK
jgi:enterochelin esterase-like enzyme